VSTAADVSDDAGTPIPERAQAEQVGRAWPRRERVAEAGGAVPAVNRAGCRTRPCGGAAQRAGTPACRRRPRSPAGHAARRRGRGCCHRGRSAGGRPGPGRSGRPSASAPDRGRPRRDQRHRRPAADHRARARDLDQRRQPMDDQIDRHLAPGAHDQLGGGDDLPLGPPVIGLGSDRPPRPLRIGPPAGTARSRPACAAAAAGLVRRSRPRAYRPLDRSPVCIRRARASACSVEAISPGSPFSRRRARAASR